MARGDQPASGANGGGGADGRRKGRPRPGVRPTTRKVLEALLQIIEHARGGLDGTRLLEVCAGTGQLGREALRRGARQVCFVEREPAVAADLRTSLGDLCRLRSHGSRAAEVLVGAAPQALRRLEGAFDVVFVDPPYGTEVARLSLEEIVRSKLLAPGGLVVVEHHHKDDVPAAVGPLSRYRLERYGETAVSFYSEPPVGTPHRAETTLVRQA